jgi:uncharacterized membrane protein
MGNIEKNNELIPVYFFTTNDQATNQRIEKILTDVHRETPFKLITLQVDETGEKSNLVPYVKVGPYMLEGEFRKQQLVVVLDAARDRFNQLTKISEQKHLKPPTHEVKFGFWDRVSLWWSQHYLSFIVGFLLLYVGLPFVAPVLMRVNQPVVAKVIYALYGPLCHQLAFRSYFLFGVQPVYPRALAGLSLPITWDSISGSSTIDFFNAKAFLGDPFLGYKVAICERDIAMYGSFALFGLIFGINKKKIPPLSLWIWLVAGVLPIALDGTSQFSGLGLNILTWLPPRESTPLLRTITGLLFGTLSGWYVLPLLEQSVIGTRNEFIAKLEAFKQYRKQT